MKVTDRVHVLKIPFQIPVGPDRVVERFVYAGILFGGGICLVDSGVAGSEKQIFDTIRKEGRDPSEIRTLVHTHTHPDHIGSSAVIRQITDCVIAVHGAEQGWMEDIERQYRERPVPGFHTLVAGGIRVDRVLADGDELDLGDGLHLDVIHVPGHSRGSVAYHLREEGVVFCGDAVLLPGDIPIYEDPLAAVRSIRRLQELPDMRVLVSAWDEPRRGAAAKAALEQSVNWLQHIHEAVRQAAGDAPSPDPLELSKSVLSILGIPPGVTNPLVARSFAANLALRARPSLLRE